MLFNSGWSFTQLDMTIKNMGGLGVAWGELFKGTIK